MIMGLQILALPISAYPFIVGKIAASFHPHTVVRWLLQQLCADHRRMVGGWVGERKGRMDKMGKKGRVHEAHGTASVGKRCEGTHLPLQLQLSNKTLHCQINSGLRKSWC